MSQPVPQDEDADSLIPNLLTVYGAYLLYRAAAGAIPRSWQAVSDQLELGLLIGDQLAMIAARGLSRQREGLGAGADELWGAVPDGVHAGVNAGLQTVAEALIWTDQQSEDDRTGTKDTPGEGILPSKEHPPVDLAVLTAQATATAAQQATASGAGWRYKTWWTVGDREVRPSHAALNGQRIPISSTFHTGDGTAMQYPGDPTAPIDERIGCRCVLQTSR